MRESKVFLVPELNHKRKEVSDLFESHIAADNLVDFIL